MPESQIAYDFSSAFGATQLRAAPFSIRALGRVVLFKIVIIDGRNALNERNEFVN